MATVDTLRPRIEAIGTQVLREFRDRPLIGALAALGALWATGKARDLASWSYLHFLRRSKLPRYLGTPSEPAWALVTGASDGIGRGFAEELCHRGFNVVLHGRTEAKLHGVKEALLKQWPQRQIRIIVIDAANEVGDTAKLEAAARSLEDINLKVLVNNVGGDAGVSPLWTTLDGRSGSDVAGLIDLNARFPTEITRVVLPLLLRNKPALIINIGSGASEIPAPYISLYAGAKAYNHAWSRSLNAEMKAENRDIEVLHIMVGLVATNAAKDRTPGGFVASSRGMAKSSLDAVGCGRDAVWAFWPHALQWEILTALPKGVVEKFGRDIAKKEIEIEKERLKQQ